MRRLRTLIAGALTLAALTLAACGGDDAETTTSPAPSESSAGAPSPNDLSQLPPEFIACMADQGYEVESPEDIHAAPPQVLQACFGSGH